MGLTPFWIGLLLEPSRRAFAHLATILPDGSPQLTPVWFDFDGSHFIVNSTYDRVKRRTMPQGARVALEISDPDNPYRYIQVRGTVTAVSEADGDTVIDQLTCKYLGLDRFPGRQPGERRVTFRISVDRTQTMDYVPSAEWAGTFGATSHDETAVIGALSVMAV
jgi:PPOX class probable F420-dependent enzyme